MMSVELSTEKYLRAAEESRRQEPEQAAAAAPLARPAPSSTPLLSKVILTSILLVVAGLAYRHRSALATLVKPIGIIEVTNGILWWAGDERRLDESQFGPMSGFGKQPQIELPEFEPITGVELGLFPEEPDYWYENLPNE